MAFLSFLLFQWSDAFYWIAWVNFCMDMQKLCSTFQWNDSGKPQFDSGNISVIFLQNCTSLFASNNYSWSVCPAEFFLLLPVSLAIWFSWDLRFVDDFCFFPAYSVTNSVSLFKWFFRLSSFDEAEFSNTGDEEAAATDQGTLSPPCQFFYRCILIGRALKFILFYFSSNFILNMWPVNLFWSVE